MTNKDEFIDLSHGSGGLASNELIYSLFLKHFDNDFLDQGNDFASTEVTAGRLIISTDSHVVTPLFFPGGDIGSLSVHGTINDIAMSGGTPLYLTAAFIIEEGFSLEKLERIVTSMAEASRKAGIPIIAGDTKVVERGKADGVFITTTGIGTVSKVVNVSGDRAKVHDAIIISGTIGDHGVAVMSSRQGLSFQTDIQSDSAALHELVHDMITLVPTIHCLRDPTRGGVAATLNELAKQSNVGMLLNESAIPVRPAVAGACELLGLDPLNIANEGKLICICPPADAETLLEKMRQHPLGKDAAIIGEVIEDSEHQVQMKTTFGGIRLIDWISSEQLPRIC